MANRGPTIWILPEAKQILDLYIGAVDYEISGLGSVTQLGPNDLLVDGVYLFEQESGEVESTLNNKAIVPFIMNDIAAGGDPKRWRLWWHSHGNMKVFWSKQDEDTVRALGIDPVNWWLSIVGNRFGEYLVRVDMYRPIAMTADGLYLNLYMPTPDGLRERIAAEVKEKVTYLPPPPVQPVKWKAGPKIQPLIQVVHPQGGSDDNNHPTTGS